MSRHWHILLLLQWYDYRIHRGVAQLAREFGWQLSCPKDPITNDGRLTAWRGDGCIGLLQGGETLGWFRSRQIPVVDLGLDPHGWRVQRVVSDNREIGRLAAEHFRDQGYREVFALNPGGTPMYRERFDALRSFMESDGGTVCALESTGDEMGTVVEELKAMAQVRGGFPEALSMGFFAYTDLLAAGLISECLEQGWRVPEDLAVLGVDDDDLVRGGLSVGLSSVDSDLEGLGAAAARTLHRLLEETFSGGDSIVRHPPKRVIPRQSTDCFAVDNRLVAKALHWIEENFYRGIQATDVAEAMGVTQQGLQKAFAASYIRTPAGAIRHQRAMAVRHLLTSSRATLREIAENCGFSSVNSLINVFRGAFGVTPGAYRKAHL